MDNMFSAFKVIIPAVFSLIGLIIAITSFNVYRKGKRSQNWQTTIGKILSSEVKKSTSTTSVARETMVSDANGSSYNSTTIFTPDVCYSYNVLSQEFISNKIGAFNYGTSSSVRAYTITNKYKVDANVTVFYDPDNPKDSILEPGVTSGNVVFLVIGIILLVVPWIFVSFFK